ncbi:MAG: histidine--tRNA ligase [bacterium]
MNSKFQSIRGFNDTFFPESYKLQYIEDTARRYFSLYNYKEIRTPLLERTELFVRGIGTGTDIVEKEMYTFKDAGGESLSLRPEGTASVVRAYLEHNIDKQDPIQKWFYIGPMFRHERPQKGRFRQFHQAGCEIFGIGDPFADVELIKLANDILTALAVPDITLRINSIGCPVCRPEYTKALKSYLYSVKEKLCNDCQNRIEKNPLRVLDCKKQSCITATTHAPKTTDYLCNDCASHFKSITSELDRLKLSYILDTRLVRGLDYYSRTVFEFTTGQAGAQNAVLAGGRYDYLVELLGGQHTPAIGFAMGIERIASLISDPSVRGLDVFIIPLTDEAKHKALEIGTMLRHADITCEIGYTDKSIKGMMRRADKLNALSVIIIGENELKEGYVTVKRLSDGNQHRIKSTEIVTELQHIIT